MKRISFAILTLTAAVLAVSCNKEAVPEEKVSAPMTISAISEGLNTPQTKAEMAFKYDVLWNDGDVIRVKNSSESVDFTLTDGAGTTKGTFSSETSISGDVEAYYPASVANLVWPSIQDPDQVCPMYSRKNLSSAENQTFNFSSLGSVLQIVFNTMQSDIILKTITIKDGTKAMSGAFTVDEDGKAVITAEDKAGINLDLGAGKTLGKGANYFNISIPAGDYTDLTLIFTTTDGRVCKFAHGKVNIAHNTVGRLTLTGENFKLNNPEGTLPGVFSVSRVKQVFFSKGNLWADASDEENITLHFEEKQWHTTPTSEEEPRNPKHVSHFTFSSSVADAVGYGSKGDYLFCDEDHKVSVDGSDAIFNALSNDEWNYLFNDRTVNGGKGEDHSYTLNIFYEDFRGMVLYPDDYTGEPLTSGGHYSEAELQSHKCVFLPAAGQRIGSNPVAHISEFCSYWTSSLYVGNEITDNTEHPNYDLQNNPGDEEENMAYYFIYKYDEEKPTYYFFPDSRIGCGVGFSIRLVAVSE